jgi:predicted nuclease of predicted toxin-antitoxin system
MQFLVDAQLPPALAAFVRTKGHACEHVSDVGLLFADDGPIWNFAKARPAVIITKDEDFPLRRILNVTGPQIVWLRIGNCSNRALLRWLDPLWADIVLRLEAGEIIVEIL